MDQGQAFDKIGSSREGEGSIVNIEKLEDFICCEFAQVVHLGSVSSYASCIKLIVGSMGHGKHTDSCFFPFKLEGFGSRRHQEQEEYWRHILPCLTPTLCSISHISLSVFNTTFKFVYIVLTAATNLGGGTIHLKNLDKKIMIGGVIGLYKVKEGQW